tara:strand:+ start:318 stop:527 length:210 start_codon:yes stop_codon:yes gene_type:complete
MGDDDDDHDHDDNASDFDYRHDSDGVHRGVYVAMEWPSESAVERIEWKLDAADQYLPGRSSVRVLRANT